MRPRIVILRDLLLFYFYTCPPITFHVVESIFYHGFPGDYVEVQLCCYSVLLYVVLYTTVAQCVLLGDCLMLTCLTSPPKCGNATACTTWRGNHRLTASHVFSYGLALFLMLSLYADSHHSEAFDFIFQRKDDDASPFFVSSDANTKSGVVLLLQRAQGMAPIYTVLNKRWIIFWRTEEILDFFFTVHLHITCNLMLNSDFLLSKYTRNNQINNFK